MTTASPAVPASTAGVLVDASGTMWRLRSLVAMGHDTARLASALDVAQELVQKTLRGDANTVSLEFRDLAVQLWDAWWDKRPPEQTHSQRSRAALARHLAEQNDWCPPLGLNEDELDEPGYRPYARYREAIGTGTAGEFPPPAVRTRLLAAECTLTERIAQPSHGAARTRASLERQRSAHAQTAGDTAPASPSCATTCGKPPERRPDMAAALALFPVQLLADRQSGILHAHARGAMLGLSSRASQPNSSPPAKAVPAAAPNLDPRQSPYSRRSAGLYTLARRIQNPQPQAAGRVGPMSSSPNQPKPAGERSDIK